MVVVLLDSPVETMWPVAIILFGIAVVLLYKYGKQTYDILSERGVAHAPPLPFVGNMLGVLMCREGVTTWMTNYCRRFVQHDLFGMYFFRQPVFVVARPEYIEQITTSAFEHFAIHYCNIRPTVELILVNGLFLMEGERWRNMRQSLKHMFSFASVRGKYDLINDNIEQCIAHFWSRSQQQAQLGNGDCFEVELSECMCKLATDVVASTMFGLKINSFEHTNKLDQLRDLIKFNKWTHLRIFIVNTFPRVADIFSISMFNAKLLRQFMSTLLDDMKFREYCNIYRSDMLQLLMGIQRESIHNWSDEEIVGQCLVVFVMALVLNSSLICYVLFDLMDSPRVQERLYQEIFAFERARKDGPLTFEQIESLKYLNMVMLESERMALHMPFLHRVCTKDYKLHNASGKTVFEFKTGDVIFIPTIVNHLDARYFENPHNFQPERFSAENLPNIKPYSFLPLGSGPRECLARNFVNAHVKSIVYHTILKYRLLRCPKTPENIRDEYKGIEFYPKCRFWLRMVPRQ